MALYDNAYSRLVAGLKIILPLLALGILSTLFLLSRNVEPSQELPYADVDAREFAREQRVGAPNYTGVASNGAAITVTADSARPQLTDPKVVLARNLTAEIKQTDGSTLNISSPDGTFNTETQNAVLTAGVLVTSSDGYRLTSETLDARMDGSRAETETPVLIEGPQNRIEAGSMIMELETGQDGRAGYVVVFNEGVKLIYTPEQDAPGTP